MVNDDYATSTIKQTFITMQSMFYAAYENDGSGHLNAGEGRPLRSHMKLRKKLISFHMMSKSSFYKSQRIMHTMNNLL